MACHALGPDNTSTAGHTYTNDIDRQLKVAIIGAGIAGLSAAVGLRGAGHDVEIFEQSAFANEVGAAIHVCPNASRIVLKWGLNPVKACFDVAQSGLTAHASTLDPIYGADYRNIERKYPSPWYLAHRVDLDSSLKELAVQALGKGTPCKIHLRSKVVAIDQSSAVITLADATTRSADLIIAADGVHSSAVKQVTGYDTPALPTGQSAFRFLIPTEDILADEQSKHFLDGKDEWNISANPTDLLHEFQSFHPDLIATMKKATDVKLWKLLYRQPLPTWHRERLLLIGDAAHPMLPHQGQAGAQSIEDGAAIGVLLTGLQVSTTRDLGSEITQRLEKFETVRRERASLMQIFSDAGQDEAEKIREEAARLVGPDTRVPSNQAEFHEFNFGYDVVGESERLLERLLVV